MAEVTSVNSSQTATPENYARFWNHMVFKAGMLIFLVLLVYWPSYHAGFIWDDEMMTRNPLVKGGWSGLRDIWFSTKFVDYVPLTLTSFWVEWHLWGMGESGYHVTNVFLHAIAVVLLWRVLADLKIPGAWLAAAIFAVHPVCVASVTWVAERKNSLSLIFYLLSLLLYFRFEKANRQPEQTDDPPAMLGHRPVFYFLSLAAFVLGLCSKTSIVVLPIVLLLCAWWQHGRISRQDLVRAIPFFTVALVFGLMTIFIHHRQEAGKFVDLTKDSFWVRSLGGSWAVWFYLGKCLFPVNLTMHYSRWEIDPHSWLSYLPALLLLASLFLFWCYRRSWGRACLFGLGYFILALSPALGVINMAFLTLSRVADHFQYIALPGIIALVVAGALHSWNVFVVARIPMMAARIFVAGILVLLSALTWQHAETYASEENLWSDNIEKNPKAWIAYTHLGRVRYNQGKLDEAISLFDQSLAVKADYAETHNRKGVVLAAKGMLSEAIECFVTALRIAPNHAEAHRNLATTFMLEGDFENALPHLREHVRVNPNAVEVGNSLAWILATHPNPKFRDGNEAVQLASHVIDLTSGTNAGYFETLAAAYAEAGDFPNALKSAQTGMGLAKAAGDEQLMERFEFELKSYDAGQPFRDPAFKEN